MAAKSRSHNNAKGRGGRREAGEVNFASTDWRSREIKREGDGHAKPLRRVGDGKPRLRPGKARGWRRGKAEPTLAKQ